MSGRRRAGADVSAWFRAARRVRRLSQRELAAAARTGAATVANAESRRRQPAFATVVRVMAAAGYDVVFVDAEGNELEPDDNHDAIRDRAGRRLPAHLSWAGRPDWFTGRPRWWGWHRVAWYRDVEGRAPAHVYYHRRPGRWESVDWRDPEQRRAGRAEPAPHTRTGPYWPRGVPRAGPEPDPSIL